MLGAYIGYFESLSENPRASSKSPLTDKPLPADCLGHVQEPTKGGDITDSAESPCYSAFPSDVEDKEAATPTQCDVENEEFNKSIKDGELLIKLMDAEETILNMKEEMDRMNKDHFEMERIMKTTYYEDRKRSDEEYSILKKKLEEEQRKIVELSHMHKQNEQFWDDRKREINDLMNDVILNVKDMCRYQELCSVFESADE